MRTAPPDIPKTNPSTSPLLDWVVTELKLQNINIKAYTNSNSGHYFFILCTNKNESNIVSPNGLARLQQ